ncbi:uncharacterized protein CANTADRAFT_32759, partial [Suhomyces tanzawaensis NRRL Y-17324]
GGDLHQLSSGQISKLINIKYHGDATLLIKQLSMDLARKESELAILAKEKFSNEQRLIRLCNEYGNLSTLEIHHKLNEKSEPEDHHHHHRWNEKEELRDVTQHQETGLADEKTQPNKSWLRNWFNSTEDLTTTGLTLSVLLVSSSYTNLVQGPTKSYNRPHSRSLTQLKRAPEPSSSTISEKDPVEMENILINGTYKEKDPVDSLPAEDLHIDKYGFFTDIEPIKKLATVIRSSLTSSDTTSELVTFKSPLQTIHQLKEIGKIHDSISLQFEHQWEILMKEIEKDFFAYSKDKGIDVGIDMMIGMKGLNLIELDNFNDKGLIKGKTDYYNRLVNLTTLLGIPSKFRFKLWLQLSGAKNLRVNGEYNELLNEAKYHEGIANNNKEDNSKIDNRLKIINHNIKQIKLDLHRTLPRNYYFNNLIELKPGPNYYKLQRILYAFVAYRPDIGYLQGMNKIVGNLLLLLIKGGGSNANLESHDRYDEEDVFWIFIGLIEEILPKYSHKIVPHEASPSLTLEQDESFYNSLLSIRVDQIVMKTFYLDQMLPKLSLHFRSIGFEIELVTMNWWLTLFIDLKFLDLDTWFKVFDNLLIGGFKEPNSAPIDEPQNDSELVQHSVEEIKKAIKLITLTLSILKCLEPTILSMSDKDSLYELLNS